MRAVAVFRGALTLATLVLSGLSS